jgi:hypothetical protein
VKIGRNQPCHCNSGKKFKHCHGSYKQQDSSIGLPLFDPLERSLARVRAAEQIRQTQQGLGRPVIATRFHDHQMVAVGDTMYWSKAWKTVPDFLADYLKNVLDPKWGDAEIQKPFEDRHPIIQWYDHYCRYQMRMTKKPGQVTSFQVTGVVACFLGLAYSLYLLAHNVELQTRLIARLKDIGNFQGAYYELIIANTLIRAGFTLTLEDETDRQSRHCEFAAISKATGKRYWVEAKMRSVAGLLGRTEQDGTTNPNPLARLTKHLSDALAKPAADERLIFIDLNTDFDPTLADKQAWRQPATTMLERYERHHPDARAYVIVTNTPFHRMLDQPAPIMALPFGLGMHDFNRPGYYRVSDVYKNKRKYIDIFNICDGFAKYMIFPTTFDGSLPSETFGPSRPRVLIGETYLFEDADNMVGTVTCATVNEEEKKVYVSVTDQQTGLSHILVEDMTDDALADYRANKDSYFGEIRPVGRRVNDIHELYEWLVQAYQHTPRAKFIEWMAPYFPPDALDAMTDDDLRSIYCEGLVGRMQQNGTIPPSQTGPTKPPSI